MPVRLAAATVEPWKPSRRAMIFFFSGRPRALLKNQTILTTVSAASEPELAKKTFDIGSGASFRIRSASSIAGEWLREPNRCMKGSVLNCLAAASAKRGSLNPKDAHHSPEAASK